MHEPDELRARFDALQSFLTSGRGFWAHSALFENTLPWQAAQPTLATWLTGLPIERIEELEASPGGCAEAPEPYNQLWQRSLRLSQVPRLGVAPPSRASKWAHVGIRGKKWAQIQAFVATLLAQEPPTCTSVLDWCGGKGHLGRTLAATIGADLRLIDKDPKLCGAARELARLAGVRCTALARDGYAPESGASFEAGQLAVALHACGSLSSEFLRHCVRPQVRFLASAGCCYHRIVGHDFVPLSDHARRGGLTLDRELARLATTEVVSPTAATRRDRRRTASFRAGLQVLATDLGWSREPLSVGYLPPSLFRLEFPAFCQAVAHRWGRQLGAFDAASLLVRGQERARRTRALDLVRWVYRRPLELWFVLDRALYLVEQGRDVRVGTFCPRTVTPRNLLLCSTPGPGLGQEPRL